jgi:hypothetical protein
VPCDELTVGEVGVMAIEISVLEVTITDAVAEPLSWLAVMEALPTATAVATPAETVAVALFEEVHLAVAVTSLESPFTVVPVAVKFMVSPMAARRETGEIAKVAMESPDEKKPEQPANSIKQITATATKPFRAKCTAVPPGDVLSMIE